MLKSPMDKFGQSRPPGSTFQARMDLSPMTRPPAPRRCRRSRERGVALLIVLTLVMLLVVLVAQLVLTATYTRLSARNYMADLQNTYGLRAAYSYSLLYLDDAVAENAVHKHHPWAQPISIEAGDAQVEARIDDEAGKIDISRLVTADGTVCLRVRQIVERLVAILGADPSIPERLADYLDADTTGPYEAGAKNDLFYQPEELLRAIGAPNQVPSNQALGGYDEDGAWQAGLLDFLTIWPREKAPAGSCREENGQAVGNGGLTVNFNTAPREVLLALSDQMTDQNVGAILAWRESPDAEGNPQIFASAGDVQSAMQDDGAYQTISDLVGTTGAVFRITARSRVGELEKAWIYVVGRGGQGEPGGASKWQLLASYRRNDFLYLTGPESQE